MVLTIKQKVFSLKESFNVMDGEGNPVYEVEGKFFSIGHKLTVRDMDGGELAHINQRVVSLRPTFDIDALGVESELKAHFTLFKQRYTLVSPGGDWEIAGDFTGHEYEMSRGGETVAAVSMRWFSWGDTYTLEAADEADALTALCVMLAIDCFNADTAAATSQASV